MATMYPNLVGRQCIMRLTEQITPHVCGLQDKYMIFVNIFIVWHSFENR